MAFSNMIQETLGTIPGSNLGLVKTKLNEAFEAIQNENIFSFQLKTGGWLTPGILGGQNSSFLSPGTISIQPYANTVIGDLVATAAWASVTQPFITQYQIRVPYYSLYSIVGYTPGAGLPYDFVLQQAPVTYPTALVLADTSTGSHYSISFQNGALQINNIGNAGTPSQSPIFLDQTTGIKWKITVVNGATSIAVATGQAVSTYVLEDTVSGYEGLMVVGGALEWAPLTFPTVNYSFSVVNGAFEFINIGNSGNPIPNPVFIDSVTGIFWQLSVVQGSLNYTQVSSPSSTIYAYPVADVTTSSGYSFQFSNGSLGIQATGLSNFASLTLDRPWMEPAQVNSGYLAYQAYFPSPAGFKEWYYISDTTNSQTMDWWSLNQIDLSEKDPQRTDFCQPEYVVAYGPDIRQGSSTYGQYLWELWEGPTTQLPYTFGCKCNWPALANSTDTLPFPITEELVKLRAFEMLSLWKEASRGDEMERGSGANWQFLAQAFRKEYDNRLKLCRNMDRNIVDLYFTRMRRGSSNQGPFASVGGQLNVGS